MKNALILFSALLFSAESIAQITLQEALKKELISVEIKGLGGHSGRCIQMLISSKVGFVQKLALKAGTIFHSNNLAEQDIVLSEQPPVLALNAYSQKQMNLRGFCIQAHNHSPGVDSTFTLGDRSRKKIAELADFIVANGLEMDGRLQSAFWCLSDNISMGSIPALMGNRMDDPLLKELSRISGVPIPAYSVFYEESAEGAVFSNEVAKVAGVLKFSLLEKDLITTILYDQHGREVKVYNRNAHFSEGDYEFNFVLEGKYLKRGTYYLRTFSNSKMLKEMKLEF